MPQGDVSPSNAIFCAGTPIIHEYEVKTATSCYPGRLVIRDTSDGNIKVAGNGATDVLGVLDVQPDELRTTIYTQYDQARVLSDCEVLVEAISGAVITAGLTLLAATGGTVIQGTTAGAVVGTALTSASPSDTGTFIRVKLK